MLEVMVVVTIIAILAAVVIPRFSGLSDDARSSAAIAVTGGVRTSIAAFRTRRVVSGGDPYPTIDELVAAGEVTQGGMPANPYSGLSTVRSVSESDAEARTVSGVDSFGWCYFVDNEADPPRATIYLNSEDETRVSESDGSYKTANQL